MKPILLEVSDLWVEVEGRLVLKGISLKIPVGETHVIFGRNGSGKTTLLMTLMGFPTYKVKQGKIYFKGEDITELPPYERARRGIGIMFQRPPTIQEYTPQTKDKKRAHHHSYRFYPSACIG